MKKYMKKIIAICSVMMLCLLSNIQIISAQEAFLIDKADINMIVNEDGSVDITETLDLDFSTYRHGLIRYIPNTYEMKITEDGETNTKRYYFPVTDVKCSDDFEISGDSNGISVKIGDPDKTIIGKKQYTISYHVQTRDLRLKSKEQALYWNLLSGFDTQTNSLTYRIEMPKTFDSSKVFTYTGAYGEYGSLLTSEVNGNVITGHMNGTLYNNQSATIRVNLPEGYFNFPEIKDYTLMNSTISGILLVIFFLLFLKFGRDDDVVVTVEFSAPNGMNSAEVGVVIDDMVQNKDIISLIIDWANRGYIRIHDKDSGFELEKISEMSSADSKGYERIFFNAIFKEKDVVSEQDMKDQKVGNALHNAKSMLQNYFNRNAKRRIYSNTSLVLQILMIFVIMIPGALFTIMAGHETYGLFAIYFLFLIPTVLLGVSTIAWVFIMRFRYTMKRSVFMAVSAVLIVVEAILMAVTAVLQYIAGVSLIGMIVCAVVTLLLIIIMVFMEKRTKQGSEWLGKILGFKEFIISCEKDQLEMLVKDDPSMFYAVLPYAYVMGITDVWVKKFETISVVSPDWYVGYHGNVFTTVLWWNHFHYCFSNISTAAAFEPSSNTGVGGGSFGGGGGFSGGGFSGGGFGGGGGGSW